MIKISLAMTLIFILLSCNKIEDNNINNKNINNKKSIDVTNKVYKIDYSNKDKKLWAKSFLGKKAPKLIVEGWIGKKPNTEGKFIILDFWGTSCPQCKRLIPILNKIHKRYKDKIVVIGLSNETKRRILSMKSHKIDYYSAYDTRSRTKRDYEVRGIPHVVIINPNGIVAWEGFPFLPRDRFTQELIAKIIK